MIFSRHANRARQQRPPVQPWPSPLDFDDSNPIFSPLPPGQPRRTVRPARRSMRFDRPCTTPVRKLTTKKPVPFRFEAIARCG